MPIPFTCPHCGAKTDVDERYAGQTGPCFQCGKTVTVPGTWTTYQPGPSSGGSGSAVVLVSVVVVAVIALFVCGGLGAFLFMARSVSAPPTPTVQFGPNMMPPAQGPFSEFTEQHGGPPGSDGFARVGRSPSSGDLAQVLRIELLKAKTAGRKPFVEIGAEWAQPCRDLHNALDDPRMREAFAGTHVIYLDVDAWGDELGRAGFQAGGVPVFFRLDEEGRPTGETISGAAWGDNTPENMAPPLKEFFQGKSEAGR